MASYGSTPRDNVHYETYGAVASSSGQGGTEEHISKPIKKVQSKDLKSKCLIGKGSSSIVYETTLEGKSYARKDFLRVPSCIFEREAAALVGLDHPNVVRTYYWTVDEGSCSLVVELMDDDLLNLMQKIKDSRRKQYSGSGYASQTTHLIDLHKFVKDGRNAPTGTVSESAAAAPLVYPFDLPEALKIMLQVAEGVKFLHDKGVAHGDLKPKNILVASNETVPSISFDENMSFKVADFGLFWTKMKSRTLVSRRARNLEQARWRAPELLELTGLREDEHKSSTDSDWDSDSSDEMIGELAQNFTFTEMASADIYNFALTCSQILSGEDPYPELSLNDLVRGILGGLRPGLPSTCPARLKALLERCWGEKTKRPSFEDIFSELKDLQDTVVNFSYSFSSIELELLSEHSEASGQSGGIPESSSVREIHQIVDIPIEHEEHSIKDIQESFYEFMPSPPADSSKETLVLKQQRMSGKASSMSGFIQKLMSRMSNEKKKKKGTSNPTEKKKGISTSNPTEKKKGISTSTEKKKGILTPMEKKKGTSTPTEKKKGISTPTEFYGNKLKRNPTNLKVFHRFTSFDVKRMTTNFNEENIIRQEGHYTVYKGIQAGTGATIAVMRLQFDFKGDFEAFKMEIELLSQLHHKYVVAMVGYCLEPDPILIYENPNNGSLFDYVHGPLVRGSTLSWRRRLHIALNATQGLEYLHMGCSPSIIHGNVKSTNILLTPKFGTKVADFGLAKFYNETSVVGTFGHLDPEYFNNGYISTKSDVYSFGVILLELITETLPIDQSMLTMGEHPHIVHWVRKRLQDNDIDSILASVVRASYPNIEALWKVAKIAMQSVEPKGVNRPSMAEVVQNLQEALTIERRPN